MNNQEIINQLQIAFKAIENLKVSGEYNNCRFVCIALENINKSIKDIQSNEDIQSDKAAQNESEE